jgi:hypothetical protein
MNLNITYSARSFKNSKMPEASSISGFLIRKCIQDVRQQKIFLISCLPYRRIKKRVTRYERPDVDGEERITAVGGNKMKTKLHCIKVLCCGLNHSHETGSVAFTYVTLTAEYRSALLNKNCEGCAIWKG